MLSSLIILSAVDLLVALDWGKVRGSSLAGGIRKLAFLISHARDDARHHLIPLLRCASDKSLSPLEAGLDKRAKHTDRGQLLPL